MPALTITGILGFLAPLAISGLKKLTWTSEQKQIVAIAVAVIFAVIAMFAVGVFTTFDLSNWPMYLFGMIGVSQAAYTLIWKPVGVERKIRSKKHDKQIVKG